MIRSGRQHLDSIRADREEVYINGERLMDLAPIRSVSRARCCSSAASSGSKYPSGVITSESSSR